MAAAQSEKDAEMKEVYDYLEYMTARDQAYLDSLEPTAEAQPELPKIRSNADPADRDRAESTVAGGRYQPGPMPTETFDNA